MTDSDSKGGLCEHHTEYDEACGYQPAVDGTPCGYVCEFCESEDPEQKDEQEDEQKDERKTSGSKDGYSRGLKAGEHKVKEMIQTMFGLGMALDQIAQIADMSAEEIEQMMKI